MNMDDNDGFYLISFSDTWEEDTILSCMDSYADDIKEDILKNKGNPAPKTGYQIEKRKNEVVRLECKSCSKYFNEKSDFEVHMGTHDSSMSFECHVCKKQFWEKSSLETHSRTHFMENPYKCGICKKGFPTIHILGAHLKREIKRKREKVNKCSISKKQIFKVLSHMQNDEKYVILSSMDSYADDIKEDIIKNKVNPAPKTGYEIEKRKNKVVWLECKSCSKYFNEKSDFDVHMRTHDSSMLFECHVCKKQFWEKSSLDTHSRIHLKENLYKCGICKKSFPTIQNLEAHWRIHKREKINKCNVSKKQILKVLSHTQNNEKYVCGICREHFSKQCFLQEHLSIHSVEELVECNGFVKKNYLEWCKMMHKKPFYKCYMCDKTSFGKENLYRHSKFHSDQELMQYQIWHDQLVSG